MSYSNIIKLHNLHSQRVLISPETSCEETTKGAGQETGFASGQNEHATVLRTRDKMHVATYVAEAESLLEDARNDADAIRLEAREKGYQDGFAAGFEAAKAEAWEHLQRVSELIADATVDVPKILNSLEESLVSLALTVANKIVNKSVVEDRSTVLSMVKGALECVDIAEVLRIRLNPEDLEVVRTFLSEGQNAIGGKEIELTVDPHVRLGGCIVDAKSSIIDANVDTKLAEIERAFRSELDARAG